MLVSARRPRCCGAARPAGRPGRAGRGEAGGEGGPAGTSRAEAERGPAASHAAGSSGRGRGGRARPPFFSPARSEGERAAGREEVAAARGCGRAVPGGEARPGAGRCNARSRRRGAAGAGPPRGALLQAPAVPCRAGLGPGLRSLVPRPLGLLLRAARPPFPSVQPPSLLSPCPSRPAAIAALAAARELLAMPRETLLCPQRPGVSLGVLPPPHLPRVPSQPRAVCGTFPCCLLRLWPSQGGCPLR